MAFVKQFLTKTQPSDNTSMFRYTPVLSSGQVEIYALISISNDVDAETSRFNKFVWDGFLDGFLSKEENIISRLESAMVGAEFKLKELIKHDNLLEEKGVDLNLSVLIFKENKVFVGVLGNHKIFIRKKRVIDISELLTKNKSKVGSTVISPEDIFTVVYAQKDMKEDLEKFKDFFEMENFLSKVFEKEDARGGAFLATLEEKKHENKVVKKKEEVEEKVEEELPKKDEISEKQENEEAEDLGGSDDEVKKKSLIFWEKLKLGFDKIITFLSQKLSVVFL